MNPKRLAIVAVVFRPRETPPLSASAVPSPTPIREAASPMPEAGKPTVGAVPIAIPATAESPVAPFQAWTQSYIAAPDAERPGMEAEGVRLAEARRAVFKEMIVSQPREALQQAVPVVVRQALPPSVLARIEERVNGRGTLRVYQGVGADNQSAARAIRVAEMVSRKTYEARVYGRRADDVLSLANASLHGVAFDQDLAVPEDTLRLLEIG